LDEVIYASNQDSTVPPSSALFTKIYKGASLYLCQGHPGKGPKAFHGLLLNAYNMPGDGG